MAKAKGYLPALAAPRVLDVGGFGHNYRECWPEAAAYWVADLRPGPDVTHPMLLPYRIPLGDDGADAAVSGQTLEHVRNPFRLVAEMARVAPWLILIAPSAGPPHEREDCWRFGRDAFKAIAEECRLVTVADWIYTGDSGGGRGRKWDDHVWVGRRA